MQLSPLHTLARVVHTACKMPKTRAQARLETEQQLKRRRAAECQPTEALRGDILEAVLFFLDANSLETAGQVCKSWREVALQNCIWTELCQELWKDKVCIPESCIRWSHTPARGPASCSKSKVATARDAYYWSLRDSRRTSITEEELCKPWWKFHFLETAGNFWTDIDPYWNKNGDVMRRAFLEDGNMVASPSSAPAWIQAYECRWRFTKYKDGVKGQYIKVNHWPSLMPSRTADWGWQLENCWVQYNLDVGQLHGMSSKADVVEGGENWLEELLD